MPRARRSPRPLKGRTRPDIDSRARVLECAAEEFARHGFAGARIERIRRRTRLNVGMLYYHFRSKKGLYAAVLEAIYDEAAKILDVTSRAEDPTQAALAMYVDFLMENPRFASVLARELLDGAVHLRALFKQRPELFLRVHANTHQLLATAMTAGVLRHEDPALTVFSMTSSLCFLTAIGSAYPSFSMSRPPSPAVWRAHLVRLLFDGMRAR